MIFFFFFSRKISVLRPWLVTSHLKECHGPWVKYDIRLQEILITHFQGSDAYRPFSQHLLPARLLEWEGVTHLVFLGLIWYFFARLPFYFPGLFAFCCLITVLILQYPYRGFFFSSIYPNMYCSHNVTPLLLCFTFTTMSFEKITCKVQENPVVNSE